MTDYWVLGTGYWVLGTGYWVLVNGRNARTAASRPALKRPGRSLGLRRRRM